MRDICTFEIARFRKNEALCKSIDNLYRRNECYFELAWDKRDPNLCERIESLDNLSGANNIPSSKEECYREIHKILNPGDFEPW